MMRNEYQLLDNQPIPILVCDIKFNVIFINKHIKDNSIGIKCGDNLYGFSAINNELLNQASVAIKEGQAFHCNSFIINYIDFHINFVPLRNKQKEIEHVVCYVVYPKMKNQNTQYHNHHSIYETLQAPTIRILNLLPLIAQKFTQLEEYDDLDHLNKIAKNSYQILRKSTEVSDYYNLINDKINFNLSYHIINNYLDNILKALQLLLVNSDYRLTYEICEEKFICLFDEDYLSTALFHIISNSCIFSPKGSTIHITLKPNNDFVAITITDEGVGIAQEKMEQVLNAFYSKIESNKGLEQESIGLGLTITQKIVESFNGKLFLSSEVNKGTSVVVALPVVTETDIPLTIKSDSNRYITNRLSNMYVYFSNICDLSLY